MPSLTTCRFRAAVAALCCSVAALFAAAFLAACGREQPAAPQPAPGAPGFPRSVSLPDGRVLELRSPPQRVVYFFEAARELETCEALP